VIVKRVLPVVTYTTLIYGFCIVGQLKEAIGFWNGIYGIEKN